MMIVAIWILSALLLAVAGVGSWVFLGWYRTLDAAPTAVLPSVEVFDPTQLERKLELLQLAVAEGIDRVDRSERRVQAVVRRARSELEGLGYENPALEAEAEQLQLVDGSGGDEEGMRPLPDGMGAPLDDHSPSGIPGLTMAQVAQLHAASDTVN